ncbi:MAG: double-strand break repair helicase AddA [Mangrovicoccus sp.]|nr:double-strand break repair helicase AddA [Mangrovicoccus sp.]
MPMDDASRAQITAADPHASTWLSANAGSGKTRVLTDRVARLLLAGVPPQSVLCLTFTKAAAAEMQNRLFETLGHWAMMPGPELRAALAKLGEDQALDGERLARAQRLFARAIETPGGLKIQTIHAFCSSLLRRFPLEARVSPQFQEMDEAASAQLMAQCADDLAMGPARAQLDAVVAEAGDEQFESILQGLMKHRALFDPPLSREAICAHLGLPAGFDAAQLCDLAFDGSEARFLPEAASALAKGTSTDVKLAGKLAALLPFAPDLSSLWQLEDALLLGKSAKIPFGSKAGKLGTKATRKAMGDGLCAALDDLADRVAEARPLRLALQSARRSIALHDFAAEFLPRMEAEKQARGWLDFDDLILRSRALLSDPSVAQWVLYKLDGGISHILVDEAQDTSPEQWDVIARLSEEIIASTDPDDPAPRTLFVVGDHKQSIYSFQGAAPDAFDAMRAQFAADLTAQGGALAQRALQFSFRSSAAVLDAVDASFVALSQTGREGCGPDMTHRAFFDGLPGRVDLWPAIPKSDGESEERAWDDPLDRPAPSDPSVQLARTIAETIANWVETGTQLPQPDGSSRPVTPGDVLILVQRRGPLFHQIIAACKSAGLPIAGADRMKLGEALAVKDLIALLSFLITPEDDLSLACALRSPLLGWSEQDLYRLAHGRAELLWAALRDSDAHPETRAMLSDLLDRADYLRPYDLLERILTRHNGRRYLIARLGAEAEDAIDALLGLALSYEQRDIPSLTGFLTWFASEEVEIKRQADSSSGQLRVMTVHGAKGLEEQIVILPDAAKRVLRNRDMLLAAHNPDWMAWKPASGEMPAVLEDAAQDWRARQEEERDRLLYVAMTRARSWLITCAAGETGDAPSDSWHSAVAAGLTALNAAPFDAPTGPGLRYCRGDWPADLPGQPPAPTAPNAPPPLPALPDWTATAAPRPAPLPQSLAPSGLGGAKALPGEEGLDSETALRRGRHLHLLLEHLPALPEASWQALGPGILALDETPPESAELQPILDEAIAVLSDPALAHLFGPGSLAEVEITAELPELDGARITGAIDRLIIGPDHILVVDFKSNAQIPATPEATPAGILRQLGAYGAALAQIYPDKPLEFAVLWTAAPRLMPLPYDLVMRALRRADPAQLHSPAP